MILFKYILFYEIIRKNNRNNNNFYNIIFLLVSDKTNIYQSDLFKMGAWKQ
jgi:hypothetical protein